MPADILDLPGPVRGLTVTEVGKDFVCIKWLPPFRGRAPICYNVTWCPISAPVPTSRTPPQLECSYKIERLFPGLFYRVGVRAFSEGSEESSLVETVFGTLPEAVKQPPLSPDAARDAMEAACSEMEGALARMRRVLSGAPR